jgi:protein-S-isoprenylcysteine O-methyltransferase Ste14
MMVDSIRQIAFWTLVGHVVFFIDTPFRTFRQRVVENRWRERLVLITTEMNLVALWAMVKWLMRWDPRLVPPVAETAVACAGLALILAGVGLEVWAKLRLGRWFSAGFMVKTGHALVTDGPYALTRHPIYTGILIALLGMALTWNSLANLALAAALAVPLFLHTGVEEVLFERHFGDAYREYQKRVPRMMPFVSPRGRSA